MTHMNKTQVKRKLAGVCVSCGDAPPATGTLRCESCKTGIRERRTARRATGMCLRCPSPAVSGSIHCPACAAVLRGREMRRVSQRRASGGCGKCGRQAVAGKYYCRECRQKLKGERDARRREGVCGSCRAPLCSSGYYCDDCNRLRREYALKYKLAALEAYGGVRCACAGCTETAEVFLTIDHINNDGAAHRRRVKGPIFRWLKRHNYPPGFQVLCMNCNWAKRFGTCPHLLPKCVPADQGPFVGPG